MEWKDLKHNDKFSATIYDNNIEGRISIDEDGYYYLCNNTVGTDRSNVINQLDYCYSWFIGCPNYDTLEEYLKQNSVFNFKLIKEKSLLDTYCDKLDIANSLKLTQFSFYHNNTQYLVTWTNNKWSDPIKLEVI